MSMKLSRASHLFKLNASGSMVLTASRSAERTKNGNARGKGPDTTATAPKVPATRTTRTTTEKKKWKKWKRRSE